MELLSSLSGGDYCVKKIVIASMYFSTPLKVKQSSEDDLLLVKPVGEKKSLALVLKNADVVLGSFNCI